MSKITVADRYKAEAIGRSYGLSRKSKEAIAGTLAENRESARRLGRHHFRKATKKEV